MIEKHNIFSPSGSLIWKNCLMAGVITEKYNLGNRDNKALHIGNLVHLLFNKMIINDYSYLKNYTQQKKRNGKAYAQAKNLYESYVVQNAIKICENYGYSLLSEQRFNLTIIDAQKDKQKIGGTVDLLYYEYNEQTLHVLDVKTGMSDVQKAHNNTQLMLYAIAAIEQLQIDPKKIVLYILQESRQNYDSALYTSNDLYELYYKTINRLLTSNYSYNVNVHCRYCNAKFHCPEIQKNLHYLTKEMGNDYR